MRILNEPRNSIVRQYQTTLQLDDAVLEFEDGALEAIADRALSIKTGARGLRSIVEELMTDIMFDLPSIAGNKRVTISRNDVEGGTRPAIELIKKTA